MVSTETVLAVQLHVSAAALVAAYAALTLRELGWMPDALSVRLLLCAAVIVAWPLAAIACTCALLARRRRTRRPSPGLPRAVVHVGDVASRGLGS